MYPFVYGWYLAEERKRGWVDKTGHADGDEQQKEKGIALNNF